MVSRDYLLHFIQEDAPHGDATSDAIIPDVICNAVVRAEQEGIIAGLDEASSLFSCYDISVVRNKKDGDHVCRNEILLSLSGKAKYILLVERTALNIIGRMSGIATQTRKMVECVAAVNPKCRVAATRKTCPGFRKLDKKAVQIGGGDPHRENLSDGILIKDNHLVLVPLNEAIHSAKKTSFSQKVEVEVERTDDALAAAAAGADSILLDNMKPGQIMLTLNALKEAGLRDRVVIELSGGIDETALGTFAALGADVISMGALTHTVRNFAVTLEILPR
jgi:nicotinate-nucleotide pyrophosphorylase (carboxylating)